MRALPSARMSQVKPNVLLITVDCLRHDHLGCYGYTRDTSPNIDKLASQGTLFAEAISCGGNTASAFPSILASALPPLRADEHKKIIQQSTTLAEIFGEAGYHTAAFTSNPFLSQLWNYNKGFDKFDEGWENTPRFWIVREWLVGKVLQTISNKMLLSFLAKLDKYADSVSFALSGNPITHAEQTSEEAFSWLNSHNKSFFLWLHYMDVHPPYMPPPRYVNQFHGKGISRYQISALWRKSAVDPAQLSPLEMATLQDLYDASIRYADDNIGWLLRKAESRLENTIIIFTADHGDEFGEHGRAGHLTLYDGIIHVPLLVSGPGIKAGTVVRNQVSLLDLAPTIVTLAGLKKVDTFHGKPLVPLMGGGRSTTKGAVSVIISPGSEQQRIFAYRTPKRKYIRTESTVLPDRVLAEELYNLKDDPGETTNLIGLETDEAREFKLEATAALKQLEKSKMEQSTSFETLRVKGKIKRLPKL